MFDSIQFHTTRHRFYHKLFKPIYGYISPDVEKAIMKTYAAAQYDGYQIAGS